MALRSGSLGTLLQGVSQQPARVRLDGQVAKQKNLISDVTLGLSTRPATDSGPVFIGADTHKFTELTLDGEEYIIGFKDGDIRLWDFDGTVFPVTPDVGAMDYVGYQMRFHVIDKKIVILNREKVVATDPTIEGRDWYFGLFHALGGQFLKTYTAKVQFEGWPLITAAYTAPDGTTAGDAAKTSSEYIIQQLVNQLIAASKPVGTVISRQFDVALIYNPTVPVQVTVSDGEGGEILRSMTTTVNDITDLPRYAPNGTVVKVTTSAAEEDDFWLKFEARDATLENGSDGFGSEGVWVEWYNPDEERLFDLTTMPHALARDGAGFTLKQGDWLGRVVGDSDSAPFASIVGSRIRDVNGFESRLALLSTSTVVMSRTNEPYNLWRESATVVNATDPVDITSTKKNDLVLDWFVAFDRDLFIMADPGDSQFVIRGGGVDATTSMVLTTEFEIASGGATPVSTGRTILFPFTTGKFSGIKEFYTRSENSVNAANSLTETQDKYITGRVEHMAVSQNFNLGLFRTDKGSKTVWVYKYLWDNANMLQSAWGEWEFKDAVRYFFFRNSRVYFISKDSVNRVFMHSLDLNRPEGAFGYHEMLDRKIRQTVYGATIDLPYAGARFLQSTGCLYAGLEATVLSSTRISSGTWRYTFSSVLVPDGATLICGQSVVWELEPSEVFAKDYQDRIDTSQKVTVQDYVVSVSKSGEFKAVGTSIYSDDWEFTAYTFPMDGDPTDPTRSLVKSGQFNIPWGERADWSTLTLTGSDLRPVTIHELEWVGQTLSTKGRRA